MPNDPGFHTFYHCYLGGHMDYRPVVLASLLACCGIAHAGYAQLAPPPGWSAGTGGVNTFKAAANSSFYGNLAKTTATTNLSGRVVTLPVALKLAPSAGKVAAAALFLSPQLRAAASIAAWLGVAGIVWDATTGTWNVPQTEGAVQSLGVEWKHPSASAWAQPNQACGSSASLQAKTYPTGYTITGAVPLPASLPGGGTADAYCVGMLKDPQGANVGQTQWNMNRRASACPAGWYVTPAGCVQTPQPRQLTQQEMVDLLNPDNTPGWPNPNTPNDFPIPLPVSPPVVNPSPGVDPFPRPMFVPTGDPVPNPKFNPEAAPGPGNQPWRQPGVTITPRPTVSEPWRVDIQPTDREQAGPEPETNPDPDTGPGDKPKPEESQSLCEKHPDILACQLLKDSGEKPTLETKEQEFDFAPESGFSGSNACPPPININASGMNLSFSMQPFCDSLGLAKPIILAFAWLSAAFIMLGGRNS